MYLYQEYNQFFAQLPNELTELAINELNNFNVKDIQKGYRGFYFTCPETEIYKINYCSRFITRILAPLISFNCHSSKYLYKKASEINWDDILKTDTRFMIKANVSNSSITHSQYALQLVKDAIVDQFQEKENKRPDVDKKDPDIVLNLYIHNNKATLSIDTSGDSLHKRGYRKSSVEAPLQETLAAALIEYSEWNGENDLYDPMCGSGTIISEAYMKIHNIPPGYFRSKWGFFFLPNFKKNEWIKIKKEIDSKIKLKNKCDIFASDKSENAVQATTENIGILPGSETIKMQKADFFKLNKITDSVIIFNPPYGIRNEKGTDMELFFKNIGDFLKQKCTSSTAYIYFGKREHQKMLGLRPAWKKPLFNGGLDGVFTKYDLY